MPSVRKRPPARTPEARESLMVSLAMDLAEKQLAEGTASSQVITHYLKLGAMRERLEKEKLEHEIELLRAKTDAIKSSKETEEMYRKAIEAMGIYGRAFRNEEESDEEEL